MTSTERFVRRTSSFTFRLDVPCDGVEDQVNNGEPGRTVIARPLTTTTSAANADPAATADGER
jgi:hypothetical protein